MSRRFETAVVIPNPDPPRLVDDDSSDVHMQRDLLRAAISPSLLYRVRRGLRAFRRRLSGGGSGEEDSAASVAP